MKNSNGSQFRYGLKDGVPIGLGYLAVSFTFGIMARGAGLDTWQAVAMSFTNLTSAGQFAALGIIQAGAPFVEMAVAQLIINLRYCLMSCSLSQKLESGIPSFHRFLMAYGVTDEIFGVSVCRPGMLSPFYNYGLICVAVPGWTLGTLLGAISGDLLPARLLSALNVALYGMFLAVVIPPAKGNRILNGVILASMALSFLFTRIPALDHISSGFKIIILTIMIAGAAAILFPVKEEPVNES
ncbi:AzlC family ABC transporter permease [Clostridium sp. FS41]|uniref:AzlC family ABC transporter permease n=1 Tax=Clostridia TaxID=186801 RepID=UPI0005D43373|nr:AzlC family ABC transporter permease [Clostridium sp. FS41]KJJ73695.1 inner membrane protein YgaZ [Clostridium sp. FS41]